MSGFIGTDAFYPPHFVEFFNIALNGCLGDTDSISELFVGCGVIFI